MVSNSPTHHLLLHYTKLISSHVTHSRHALALSLFHHVHSTLRLPLDPHLLSLTLKSCTALNLPLLATSLHAHAAKSALLANPFVASALLHLYGTRLSLPLAHALFLQTPPPHRNVVVWNAIISLHAHHHNLPQALRLFRSLDTAPTDSTFNPIIAALAAADPFRSLSFYRGMLELNLKPRLITLLSLLPACVSLAALNLIKEVHGYAVRNSIHPHRQLSSALVEAYGRCGSLRCSSSVFWRMRDGDRDVVAWSSLISACAFHGEAEAALEIFRRMEAAGVRPDGVAFLGVLKACSHAGLADEALRCFARMREGCGVEPGSDHYSCLVDVLGRAGRLREAYEVIKGMPVMVTAKAWGALLGACRNFGELRLAEVAAQALAEVEPGNAANYVLLGKMYASVGRMEEAQRVRREMRERGVRAAAGSSWVVYSEV
ncbi:putative pentatricopeptide repeat-containing protein [Spatholobus suberectus]|nr:putative pentatricopeptide repeat-containing protein [Spatholobus suberectus]